MGLTKLGAFLLTPLCFYALYAMLMFSKQESILFPASLDRHYPLTMSLPTTGRLIGIPASYGTVRTFYQPASAHVESGPVILYMHGNYECIQNSFSLVRPLVDRGIGVLQLEFPGFCGADGAPTFANIVEAATQAYDWLASQSGVDKSRIVAMGYSIGAGAASELTRHRSVAALVLLSTFTSMSDMAHRYGLPGFLVRYPFDNLRRMQEFAGPIFLEHGKRDRVIPFEMGQALAASKPGAEFVVLDCGHDDCHFDHTVFSDRLPVWLAMNGMRVGR